LELSPNNNFQLISSENIDHLIPDFLMESEHFFLILLDVEGTIVKSNRVFSRLVDKESGLDFHKMIDEDSSRNFSELLEKALDSPKEVQHALFNIQIEKTDSNFPVWWEFSVITNSEGDFLGIIAVGVGIQFLEQGMPWDNLVDVLQFGRIMISPNMTLIGLDEKVAIWLDNSATERIGSSILNKNILSQFPELSLAFKQISENGKPVCQVLKQDDKNLEFATLLTKVPEGFHLFILPREKKRPIKELVKPFTTVQLGLLQGAVWVVDSNFKILQLNKDAKRLGILWKGRELNEGSKFHFIQQSENFSNLITNCKSAFSGNSIEFEIQTKIPDQEIGMWRVGIRPVYDPNGVVQTILIQAFDLFVLNQRLLNLQKENQNLKELAMRPSHILRSPLSSMLGLLDLIDQKQLDSENQKYFSYLKPLAKELDDVIRSNAKKMSALN
jgi:hypothetical protein